MMCRSYRAAFLMIGLMVAPLAGCPDETIVLPPKDIGADGELPTWDVPPDGADLPIGPDDGQITASDRLLLLLHDTASPLQLKIGDSFQISAQVIDKATDEPVEGALVSFQLVEGADVGDAQISPAYSYSDEAGVARATFKAKTVPDVLYRLRVKTEGAASKEMEIEVVEQPKGTLQVLIEWESSIALKTVDIRVVDGMFSCGQFNPVKPPEGTWGAQTLLGTGADAEFDDLPVGQLLTVVAVGHANDGALAAKGCYDGAIVLQANGTTTITLQMKLLVLKAAGVYDAESTFDLTGAIPGQAGEIAQNIVTLFTDPGQFLIDMIKLLVSQYVGEWVTDVAFGLFEDALSDIITDWMLNQSPDWMQDIFIVGNDLIQVVDHLTLRADLIISKIQEDYLIQGVFHWKGIVLYWKLGCAAEGEPDYDEACGEYVFTTDDLNNTQFPQDMVEGKFAGIIWDFDHLEVYDHAIKLNYGKLIIFAVNELLLPAVTGYHSLEDTLVAVVDCHQIGQSFDGAILQGIGITPDAVEEFCEDSIHNLAGTFFEGLLGNLALDSQLSMSGTAMLYDDEPFDLIVDEFQDGVWEGHVEVGGEQGAPFTGTWWAKRQQQ